MNHTAQWITTREFAALPVNQVFHRQLDLEAANAIRNDVQNRHVLFRRRWNLENVSRTILRITADDYYKLYINGRFVCQGPTADYPQHYLYNTVDVTDWLKPGENVIAVHTYYQGLINRVWVSGDNRHGLWLDMTTEAGETVLVSDDSFRMAIHTGFTSAGISGYKTQFMERYDAAAPECGFEHPCFDDSTWEHAIVNPQDDHTLFPQTTRQLVFEDIAPATIEERKDGTLLVDFGRMAVGSLTFTASGRRGDEIRMHFGQELEADGSVRYQLRANCVYEEYFRLSGKDCDRLIQFDFKSFRYLELMLPDGARLDRESLRLQARHYPFELKARFNGSNASERAIWELCVSTLQYGVQEVIQDCMEREKGYYLGDGCYSMLTFCLLTQDWSLMEKFFDDFLRTAFITPTLVTCACCSFMQEIAEYPLIMFTSLLEYLEITGNSEFVKKRYAAFAHVLDAYAQNYADEDGLLTNLDKWCVIDWPEQYRDGYDADVRQGKVCTDKHNVINAYYIGAVKCLNKIAATLGLPCYRDATPLENAFEQAFFDSRRHLYRDRVGSDHVSLPANVIAWWFQILPDEETRRNIIGMVREKRLTASMFFMTFPMFCCLRRDGETELLHSLLTDDGGWLNMLREGATATFEGWGKDKKWNTSLFHLTLSYGAAFLTDWPVQSIFTF